MSAAYVNMTLHHYIILYLEEFSAFHSFLNISFTQVSFKVLIIHYSVYNPQYYKSNNSQAPFFYRKELDLLSYFEHFFSYLVSSSAEVALSAILYLCCYLQPCCYQPAVRYQDITSNMARLKTCPPPIQLVAVEGNGRQDHCVKKCARHRLKSNLTSLGR